MPRHNTSDPSAASVPRVSLGAEHARAPAQLMDLVMPCLSPAEQICLWYMLRRVYGFASPLNMGHRKQWDRVSLNQLVEGNSAGGFILDRGTGLSRSVVARALQQLEEKGLIRISYECVTELVKSKDNPKDNLKKLRGCGWSQKDDDYVEKPQVDPEDGSYQCPRCQRKLSKAYTLRTVTPGLIKRFLDQADTQGKKWGYDAEVERYYPGDAPASSPEPAQETDKSYLRSQLWFPDLVDSIVEEASQILKSGSISEKRITNNFYLPVLEMQRQGIPKEAIGFGLEEVLKRNIAKGKYNRRWHAYARACATSWVEKRYGSEEQAQQQMQTVSIEEQLKRCAELNRAGKKEEATKLLHDLLNKHLDKLAVEFGDRRLARRYLLEAFKRGVSDYSEVRDYTVATDYLPEWSWEIDETQGLV